MRRAGLDYHEFAGIHVHPDWAAFREVAASGRVLGISTKGTVQYADFDYQPGDFLVFGPETRGLPQDIRDELGPEQLLRIPMMPDSRSLNLSNAAAVITYEAWRQLGFAASQDY